MKLLGPIRSTGNGKSGDFEGEGAGIPIAKDGDLVNTHAVCKSRLEFVVANGGKW